MLFKTRNAVLVATVVAVVMGVVLLSGHSASASPPDKLIVDQETVSVGQILDAGVRSEDGCTMNYDEIEVVIDVSLDEPTARVTLRIDENCKLLVVSTYRDTAPIGVTLDEPSGAMGALSFSHPRYAVWSRAWYEDFAGIHLAVTRLRYNYEERPGAFRFTFGPWEYCHTVSWWDELECSISNQREGSSSITATAYGRYRWHVTGWFNHKQKATFTARPDGRGAARCWTNTKIDLLTFHCDGGITRSN